MCIAESAQPRNAVWVRADYSLRQAGGQEVDNTCLFFTPYTVLPTDLTNIQPFETCIVSLKWCCTSNIEQPVMYNVTIECSDESNYNRKKEYQTNGTEVIFSSPVNDIIVTIATCNGTLSVEGSQCTVNVTCETKHCQCMEITIGKI